MAIRMRRPPSVNALMIAFLLVIFAWNLYMNVSYQRLHSRRIFNRTTVPEPRFIIRPSLECENIDLLVVIPSVADHFAMRQTLREKWNQHQHAAVKTVFLLGRKTNKQWNVTLTQILNESRSYDDIILTDVLEYYRNLTMKTWAMLLWVESHCPVRCLFKTDEDSVVNINHISALCSNSREAQNGTIIGRCYAGFVVRDTRYKEYIPTDVYKPTHYPTFCAGVGYLMIGRGLSTRLLDRLVHVSWNDARYRQIGEDVLWTGILGEIAQVHRQSNAGFSTHKAMAFDCNKTEKVARAYVMHYFGSPETFRNGWEKIQTEGTKSCS